MSKELMIGLSYEVRFFVSRHLNMILAQQFLLYLKLLNYHWNVKGPHFNSLHLLFRQGYELLFDSIDETAERSVQLGFPAIGTITDILTYASEKKSLSADSLADNMIKDLVNDLQALIIYVREIIIHCEGNHYHDSGTSNFLAGILEKYEKYLWLLRHHVL